jgi:ubiquinone/menaquinone biosynthesis C-methylase UbiE
MNVSGTDEICKMYEESADWYAEMMDSEIKLPVYAELLGRLHKNIAGMSGSLIDAACGSGHMLVMYHESYEPDRPLYGIDLSPGMVTIARKKLGNNAQIETGDMRSLSAVNSASAAALINFFAIHHLDSEGVQQALHEWNRVLQTNGQLLVAAWEGSGPIDYGDDSDIVAIRYRRNELVSQAQEAGFVVSRCDVEPVEGFPMDAIYLEAIKEH